MKKVLIIAEAGVNHNGSLALAKQLVDAASKAGVDYVKFQTFKADRLATKALKKAKYQNRNTEITESQFDMLKRLELSKKEYGELDRYCKSKKIRFLSSPFDVESLEFLVKELKLKLLKIPSGELTNTPLLLRAAQLKCDVILSTGMATLADIENALGVLAFGYLNEDKIAPSSARFRSAYAKNEIYEILKEKVSILHCTTDYPTPLGEVNLAVMDGLKKAFDLNVGYSDHTEGIVIPIAAVARGACIIEKHFTLDRHLPGPDHKASLEPQELKSMVSAIRAVEKSMGCGRKFPTPSELENAKVSRKKLVAIKSIKRGEKFSVKNIDVKRAGGEGISAYYYWDMIGTVAGKNYQQDEVIVR